MVKQYFGKTWTCNLQCNFNGKTNCCQEIFLPVNNEQKKSIEKYGYFIVGHKYTDFRWIDFRPSLEVKKVDFKKRMIRLSTKDYEFKHHTYLDQDMLYLDEKCDKLLPDGKCKVYRNRPMICKQAECPVFTNNPNIYWYAQNSKHMKEAREKHEKGDLSAND